MHRTFKSAWQALMRPLGPNRGKYAASGRAFSKIKPPYIGITLSICMREPVTLEKLAGELQKVLHCDDAERREHH